MHMVFTHQRWKSTADQRPTRAQEGESSMKHTYAKSEKAYARTSVFERKKILAAAKRLKKSRKLPTSIALEERTINE